MKKIFILTMLIISGYCASAQIGLKLLSVHPNGDLGFYFDKKMTGEIIYVKDFDGKSRGRMGLTYINFEPRLDTFPTYGYLSDGNGFHVLPGHDVYEKFSMVILSGGMDWGILIYDKFNLYAGIDILMGGTSEKYYHYIETYIDEQYEGGNYLGGLRPRVGGEYFITDEIVVSLEACRGMYLVQERSGMSHNEFGLGVKYLFE